MRAFSILKKTRKERKGHQRRSKSTPKHIEQHFIYIFKTKQKKLIQRGAYPSGSHILDEDQPVLTETDHTNTKLSLN